MNWLLIFLVLLVAGNMVWGFQKGLVRVLYSMLGWILVLILSVWVAAPLEAWLESAAIVHGTLSGTFVAFLTALIISKLLFHLLVKILDLVARLPLLKEVNHFLGVLAGTGKGLFVTELLLLLIALGHNTGIGNLMEQWVYESPLLTFLYENNVVQVLIMTFL